MRRLLVQAVTVALALGFLGACGATATRRPTVVSFDLSRRAEVWARAVMLLRAQNYSFEIIDETSGTIETELNDIGTRECGLAQCTARQRISLNVNPAGAVTCTINRYFAHGTSPDTFTPDSVSSVREIETDQAALVRSILSPPGRASAAVPDAAPAGPPVQCYSPTGASVAVATGGCAAAGLSETAPAPTSLHCFSSTGMAVSVEGSSCEAAGLSATAPAAEAAPTAGPHHHHHHRDHH